MGSSAEVRRGNTLGGVRIANLLRVEAREPIHERVEHVLRKRVDARRRLAPTARGKGPAELVGARLVVQRSANADQEGSIPLEPDPDVGRGRLLNGRLVGVGEEEIGEPKEGSGQEVVDDYAIGAIVVLDPLVPPRVAEIHVVRYLL